MSGGPQYLRAAAIARLLGVSERTVWRLIASGELPSVKIRGARLVAIEDLERLLDRPNPFDEEGEDNDE